MQGGDEARRAEFMGAKWHVSVLETFFAGAVSWHGAERFVEPSPVARVADGRQFEVLLGLRAWQDAAERDGRVFVSPYYEFGSQKPHHKLRTAGRMPRDGVV